jgi:hypothetical protein
MHTRINRHAIKCTIETIISHTVWIKILWSKEFYISMSVTASDMILEFSDNITHYNDHHILYNYIESLPYQPEGI